MTEMLKEGIFEPKCKYHRQNTFKTIYLLHGKSKVTVHQKLIKSKRAKIRV